MNRSQSKYESFLGVVLLTAFLLPHNNLLLMMVNPLLCIVLFLLKNNKTSMRYIWVPVIPIIISLLLNVNEDISAKAYMSTLSVLLFLFCFPMTKRASLKNKYIYICLGVIFVSQIAYLLNIPFVSTMFDRLYPITWNEVGISNTQQTATWDNMMNYRFGGLYRNPNQCARYLSFLLASYLILNRNNKLNKTLPFTLVALFAIIITGSRTGFFIASLIVSTYLLTTKSMSSFMRLITVVIIFVLSGLLFIEGSGTFRGISFELGIQDSIGSKWDVVTYYLNNESSFVKLLFGNLDYNNFEMSGDGLGFFDCDYGYIIYSFGVVGFLSIVVFFALLYKKTGKGGRLFFFLLLWMISSTIVMSFRAFFIFMCLLSIIYMSQEEI